jgi:hypothetical protein
MKGGIQKGHPHARQGSRKAEKSGYGGMGG